jgi:palmitoyl-[glycerolipid] 3-(E)-desaturase
MLTALQILLAYILADLFSGLYHLATDKGMNIKSQCEMFQEHHVTNTMASFDWQTFAAGMPLCILGGWLHSAFLIALGVFLALTQVTHYYAHRKSDSQLVHHVVRVLQLTGVIVNPTRHARHHSEPFSRDFCLLSGWCNPVLNAALEFYERFPWWKVSL